MADLPTDQQDAEPAEYVAERVREAVAKDPRLAELHLQVHVVGRRVVLDGDVATEERRRVLGEVVSELLPDREIQNHITVVSFPEVPKVERLS